MLDSTFIGLDVHKAAISVAVAKRERGGEVRHWGTVRHRHCHVRKLGEKLTADGRRNSLKPRERIGSEAYPAAIQASGRLQSGRC